MNWEKEKIDIIDLERLLDCFFSSGSSLLDSRHIDKEKFKAYCDTHEHCCWLNGVDIVSQVESRYTKRAWDKEVRIITENLVFFLSGRKPPEQYNSHYHFDLIKPVLRENGKTIVVLENAAGLLPKTVELFASFGKSFDEMDHELVRDDDGRLTYDKPATVYFFILSTIESRKSKYLKNYVNAFPSRIWPW